MTICEQVWGRRWSCLTADERRRTLCLKRLAWHYRHLADTADRLRGLADRKKRLVLEALGWPVRCASCGYDRCLAALDFHHLDPAAKDGLVLRYGLPRAIEEARKCTLLCSNCHREAHANDTQQSSGRPRSAADAMLGPYLRASGLSEAQVEAALKGRPAALVPPAGKAD